LSSRVLVWSRFVICEVTKAVDMSFLYSLFCCWVCDLCIVLVSDVCAFCRVFFSFSEVGFRWNLRLLAHVKWDPLTLCNRGHVFPEKERGYSMWSWFCSVSFLFLFSPGGSLGHVCVAVLLGSLKWAVILRTPVVLRSLLGRNCLSRTGSVRCYWWSFKCVGNVEHLVTMPKAVRVWAEWLWSMQVTDHQHCGPGLQALSKLQIEGTWQLQLLQKLQQPRTTF
jgi:hypothetical protein